MKYGGFRLVPQQVSGLRDPNAPVQLFIVEEIRLRHRSDPFYRLPAEHHGGAVTIRSDMRSLILSPIGFSKTDQRISQRNAAERSIPGELNIARRIGKTDLRGDASDPGIVFQHGDQLPQRTVLDEGVVVQQQQIIAPRRSDPEVISSGESEIPLATNQHQPLLVRKMPADSFRFVRTRSVVDDDRLERNIRQIFSQGVDQRYRIPVSVIIDGNDRQLRLRPHATVPFVSLRPIPGRTSNRRIRTLRRYRPSVRSENS